MRPQVGYLARRPVKSVEALMCAMKNRLLWLLLGTCCLSWVPVVAQAQGETAPEKRVNEFKVSVGVGGGYTSNPGLRSSNGELNGDTTGDLRASLMDRRSSPRTTWSARYESFYASYASNSQFDAINHALNFDGSYLVTPRAHLKLVESFFYSRNPLQTGVTLPGSDAIIVTRQANRWRSDSNIGLDTSLSRSVTLQVGATSRIERLDTSPSIDINTYSGHLGIQKQAGRNDIFASTYSYSRFDFRSDGTADSEAHGVDLSWSHGPVDGPGGVISGGVSRVMREGQSQEWLMAGASFFCPIGQSRFVSGYRRSLDADAAIASITVAQNAYAGLTRNVGRSGSLGVYGEYGTRESVEETAEPVSLRYTGGALRGSIALTPRVQLSGEARRRVQTTTNGTGDDLKVDTLFLGLAIQVF